LIVYVFYSSTLFYSGRSGTYIISLVAIVQGAMMMMTTVIAPSSEEQLKPPLAGINLTNGAFENIGEMW
jgi:hypothetical protein